MLINTQRNSQLKVKVVNVFIVIYLMYTLKTKDVKVLIKFVLNFKRYPWNTTRYLKVLRTHNPRTK